MTYHKLEFAQLELTDPEEHRKIGGIRRSVDIQPQTIFVSQS